MKTKASKLIAAFLAMVMAFALVATSVLVAPVETKTLARTDVTLIDASGNMTSALKTSSAAARKLVTVSQSDEQGDRGLTKSGVSFPGSNSAFAEVTDTSWITADGFSFAAWVYWRGESGAEQSQLHWQRLFDFGYESPSGAASCFYFTPLGQKTNEITGAQACDGLGFMMYENANSSTTTYDDYVAKDPSEGTTALAGGQWVHVACTVSGNTATVYINGSQYVSKTIGTSWSKLANDQSNMKLYIGKSNKTTDTKMAFNGIISDAHVYSGALSASEVASLASTSSGSGSSIGGSAGSTLGGGTSTGGTTVVNGNKSAAATVSVEVESSFDMSEAESKASSEASAELASTTPGTVSSSVFSALKSSGNTLSFDVVDSSSELLYEWSFNGADITDESKEVNLEIVTNGTSDAISALVTEDIYPYILNFSNKGDLPGKASIKVYVGDKYADDQPLYLYIYNEDDNKLELISQDLVVSAGYIEFETEKTGDMVLTVSPPEGASSSVSTTTSTVSETTTQVVETHDNSLAIMILWIVVAALLVLGVGAIVILQVLSKKNKQ